MAELLRKPHKYRAVKTEYAGEWYPSKAEAAYAEHLDTLMRAQVIGYWIRVKKALPLVAGITYRPDFYVGGIGKTHAQLWHVEVKGVETPVWKLKLRLYKHVYPDHRLVIAKLDHGRWVETDA